MYIHTNVHTYVHTYIHTYRERESCIEHLVDACLPLPVLAADAHTLLRKRGLRASLAH